MQSDVHLRTHNGPDNFSFNEDLLKYSIVLVRLFWFSKVVSVEDLDKVLGKVLEKKKSVGVLL